MKQLYSQVFAKDTIVNNERTFNTSELNLGYIICLTYSIMCYPRLERVK